MYINKSKKGYGYYSPTAKGRDKNGEEFATTISVDFKKGAEPIDESIKGELYFVDEFGNKRPAFFSAYRSNGEVKPKLFLMEIEHGRQEPKDDWSGFDFDQFYVDKKDNKDIIEEIKADDLPFY